MQGCNRGARDEGPKRGESVTNRYIEPLVEPTCARNRHSSVVELRSSFGNDISPVAVFADSTLGSGDGWRRAGTNHLEKRGSTRSDMVSRNYKPKFDVADAVASYLVDAVEHQRVRADPIQADLAHADRNSDVRGCSCCSHQRLLHLHRY